VKQKGQKRQYDWGADDQARGFSWPADGKQLGLMKGEMNIFSVTAAEVTLVIHKKQWWNWLIGNPMGYLPAGGNIDQIMFNFKPKIILTMGPKWMHDWMFPFFMFFLVFSIAYKFILKIA